MRRINLIDCNNFIPLIENLNYFTPEDSHCIKNPIGFCDMRKTGIFGKDDEFEYLRVNNTFCLICKKIDWLCPKCEIPIGMGYYGIKFKCPKCGKVIPKDVGLDIRKIKKDKLLKIPRPKYATYSELNWSELQ